VLPFVAKYHQRAGGLLCLLTVLPVGSVTKLLWVASSVLTEAPTHSPPVKHSQHTVNPLITPHVNPFLPSAISNSVSAFYLALITVLVSLGISVTPS
ncbi:unnamed protein product, partial [Staurois parvus]